MIFGRFTRMNRSASSRANSEVPMLLRDNSLARRFRSIARIIFVSLLLLPCACAPAPEAAQSPQHPWMHEGPDGKIYLQTVDHMHVMNMVAWCLQNQRYDLLLEQVIAEQTKQEYRNLGRDPLEAVQWMVDNERDVYRLFSLLRASRGRVENAGRGRLRLTLYGQLRLDMPVTEMEVVMEDRVWKLSVIR